jgi:hypothetical protein
MIVIIVISFLALIGAIFTIYALRQTPSREIDRPGLPTRHFEGLFDSTGVAPLLEERHEALSSARRTLVEIARNGDLTSLSEAHSTGDAALYSDVLSALLEWASNSQEDLAALVSRISKSGHLRANNELARRLIEKWKTNPDRRSTTEMIHIAALSDDAESYQQAVEAALDMWRRGQLAQFSADELAELLVSQYWVIAPEARRGGVGFALKRKLSGVRRELATTTSAR